MARGRIAGSYRMPVDVFGDRVDHDIGAVVEGVLHVGAEEGVVDDDHNAVSVGHRGDVPDIHQAQGGVAGTLDPDQLRLIRADELGHVDLDARRKRDLDAMGGSDFGEVAMRAAVDIRDRDHVGALGERLEDQRRGGGARGECEGEAGMFQRRDRLFEIVPAVSIKRQIKRPRAKGTDV